MKKNENADYTYRRSSNIEYSISRFMKPRSSGAFWGGAEIRFAADTNNNTYPPHSMLTSRSRHVYLRLTACAHVPDN